MMSVVGPIREGFYDWVYVNHNISYDRFVDSLDGLGFNLEELGDDGNGNTIWGMKLGKFDGSKPVIMLTACIHGERFASFYLIDFLRRLTDNSPKWRSELDALKDAYDFYAVPVVTPSTFISGQRPNWNGVDINRNFDYKWEEYDPGSDPNRQKGDAPFSEAESRAIRDLVLAHKPFVVIDIHDWGGLRNHTFYHVEGTDSRQLAYADSLYENLRRSLPMYTFEGPSGSEGPTLTNWSGAQQSAQGNNILSVTTETGTLAPTDERSAVALTMIMFAIQDAIKVSAH